MGGETLDTRNPGDFELILTHRMVRAFEGFEAGSDTRRSKRWSIFTGGFEANSTQHKSTNSIYGH